MATGERYEAFVRLLAKPDLPCLPPREHRVTQLGEIDRHVTRLPKIFIAWYQRLLLERTPDEQTATAKKAKRVRRRRTPVLSIARSACR